MLLLGRFVCANFSRANPSQLAIIPTQEKDSQTMHALQFPSALASQAEVTIPTYLQHQTFLCTRCARHLKFIPLQATCDANKFSF